MRTKRSVTRRGSDESGEVKIVRELARRAQTELAKLAKRNQAGTITKVELDTGLEELEERLEQLAMHQKRI